MTLWFITRKPAPPLEKTPELSHEIINAVLGIQLERKIIAQSLLKIGQHQQRIEEALNKCNGGSGDD